MAVSLSTLFLKSVMTVFTKMSCILDFVNGRAHLVPENIGGGGGGWGGGGGGGGCG